jgi:hypothetical protein
MHEANPAAVALRGPAMFLERVVQHVEQGVANLGRRLMRPDERTQLREDVVCVMDELASRQKALTQCREELDALRDRVNQNHATVALLVGRIGMSLGRGAGDRAWRDALDLDKARRQLAEDQARLPKVERLAATLELQVRFLIRRLARLQDKLYWNA